MRLIIAIAVLLALVLGPSPARAQADTPVPCNQRAIYDASTSGSTRIIVATFGRTIYLCGFTLFAAGTVNVGLNYGTGTNCGTGTTALTPAFQLVAQSGLSEPSPFYRGMTAAVSTDVCLLTTAGVAVQAIVYYGFR